MMLVLLVLVAVLAVVVMVVVRVARGGGPLGVVGVRGGGRELGRDNGGDNVQVRLVERCLNGLAWQQLHLCYNSNLVEGVRIMGCLFLYFFFLVLCESNGSCGEDGWRWKCRM